MSKIIVYNQEGMFEGEYVLDKERFTIGRKPQNDLMLPQAVVSSEHALIITIRNDSFLEDLDSTNGVRVNNSPVKKCVLQDEDEIKIGTFLIKYVYEELPLPVPDPVEDPDLLTGVDTVVMKRNSTRGNAHHELDLATTHKIPHEAGGLHDMDHESVPANRIKAVVRMLSGAGAGKELGLDKMLTTIGKPGLQVAVITRRSRGYFLTHIEGGNLPLVNGVRIGPHSHELKNHDIIELADIKMEFFLKQ